MKLSKLVLLGALSGAAVLMWMPQASQAAEGDPRLLQLIHSINDDGLKPQWLDYRVEQIELFTVGGGRLGARVHQQPYRWVPGDARRDARAGALTYLVDPTWGTATTSGVTQSQTETAIDGAMKIWAASACLSQVDVTKLAHPGGDVTIFDFFLDRGDFGEPFAADIVHAGWYGTDAGLFGPEVLGISVTFIFVDPVTGEPTDVDGDQYMDTALNEIYYSDGFDWTLDPASGGIDLETVALHESGHAFGVGHFGSPPEAVMNPAYTGPRHALLPIDEAGLCTVWGGFSAR